MTDDKHEPVNKKQVFEFHMEEFRLLKEEILQHDKSKNQSEILTFASVGIVYGFIFQFNEFIVKSNIYIVWFVPCLLLIFGYLRIIAYRAHIRLIGSYLKNLTLEYSADHLGWEKLVDSLRRQHGHLTANPRIIWLPFFVFSILAGIRFGFGPSFWPYLFDILN